MIKFIKNIFKKEELPNYYRNGSVILSLKDKIEYDYYYNKYNNFKEDYCISWFDESDEEEFNKLHKNKHCNCKLGDGHNIKCGSKFSNDELVKLLKQKCTNIEINPTIYFDAITFRPYIYFDYNGQNYSFNLPGDNYFKRACIQCGTCLSDFPKFYQNFIEHIKEIDEENAVNQICKDNE